MKKFEMVDVYDRRTGKKLNEQIKQSTSYYCDYCGKFMTDEDEGPNSITYVLKENGGSEESWYYMEWGNPILEEYDNFSFWSNQNEYHYCMHEYWDESCSGNMVSEAQKITSLHNLMQDCRIKVVNKLCESGVSPEELGFENEE